MPLFHAEAYREAVINAFVHNLWIDGNAPMFTGFRDRIEILSRGHLPPKQTVEGFFAGESVPVNQKLSDIFLQLHISERSGRGIPKITELYGEDCIELRENSIVVTIPFERLETKIYAPVDDENVPDDMEHLGYRDKKTVRKYLTPLLQQGRISMTIPDKPNSKNQKQKQINDLQLENQILKNILDRSGISYTHEITRINAPENAEEYDPDQGAQIIHPRQITDEMANLFYARFWGRQDVYAKRSEKKGTGEAGYYTQCHNRWENICPKMRHEKMNCKDCPHRAYKQLTIKDIRAHLQGRSYNGSDVIGVYPLLKNGMCRFLIFDFDNHEKGAEKKDFANTNAAWMEEVEAMRTICVLNGIDPLVERSRSGRGAHLWIFFDKPLPAALARRFGFALLEKEAEQVKV